MKDQQYSSFASDFIQLFFENVSHFREVIDKSLPIFFPFFIRIGEMGVRVEGRKGVREEQGGVRRPGEGGERVEE